MLLTQYTPQLTKVEYIDSNNELRDDDQTVLFIHDFNQSQSVFVRLLFLHIPDLVQYFGRIFRQIRLAVDFKDD